MNWASLKTRFAYSLYFSYSLPDTHEKMIETLCKDYFEVPMHYKQSNLMFEEKSLKTFLQPKKAFIQNVQNIHDFGDQLLRMSRAEAEKELPYFLK